MSAPVQVRVDGQPATAVDVRDRGLHYGDGLFETVIVRRGRARFAALHGARLARGLARLGFPSTPAPDFDALAEPLGSDGVLKLIVTRGDARARGYGTTGDETPRQIVFWYPATTAAAPIAPGSVIVLAEARWGENPALAGLKHLNRLEQVLARQELARTVGADEGLVRSVAGAVVSGTQTNLFVVRGTQLLTPPVDRCGIAGVMREVVLREAAAAGFSTSIATLERELLRSDDALFLTNARVGVWPVARLDGRALGIPESVLRLARRIEALDA